MYYILLTLAIAITLPILHKLSVLVRFYNTADCFWSKLKALCWKSATIAWGYLVLLGTALLSALDQFGASLGDPDLKQQISSVFADHGPQIIALITVVGIVARLRSIRRDSP